MIHKRARQNLSEPPTPTRFECLFSIVESSSTQQYVIRHEGVKDNQKYILERRLDTKIEFIIAYYFIFASRFTKNLSPDKIKVSTLKGEGDLCNLDLDENVLMQILDLPTWLRLTKAHCNKLSIKVRLLLFSIYK